MLSSSRQVGSHYDVAAVDAENIVYPMHPERSEAIRRWATNVGREQSHHDVASSHPRDTTYIAGRMPIEASIASADTINRAAHLLNLANSNVHPPELSHVNPLQPPAFSPHPPPVRPTFTRRSSMFSGASGITLAGGTFTNCGGSLNVTYAANGDRTVINRSVDSTGNITVTRILNAGTHIRLESSMFSGIKDTVFTGGTFTHAPQFNRVVYGQGPPDTINAMPHGLPPRHLRSSTPPPAYTE